jgi:hypothetical protein
MNSLNALDEEYNDDDEDEGGYSQPYDANTQAPPAKVPKSGAAPDVGGMEKQMRNTSLSAAAQARQQNAPRAAAAAPAAKGYGQHSPEVAAAAKRQVKNKAGAFELSLDNATLLGRRGKKEAGPSGLRQEQVVQ